MDNQQLGDHYYSDTCSDYRCFHKICIVAKQAYNIIAINYAVLLTCKLKSQGRFVNEATDWSLWARD